MNVLLQSPNTSKTITLPFSFIGAPMTVIQHHLECHPPTFPSDASWDILCPGPESSIATFTRPPLMERSNLQKAALIQTRKELADKEATFEDRLKGLEEEVKLSHKVLLQRVAKKEKSCDERLKFLEGKIQQVNAMKASQMVLMGREADRHIHILRYETYTRTLQVINDNLMANLTPETKSQMRDFNLGYITSILEGVYPHAWGPHEQSPRERLIDLAGQPTFPTFHNPTERMELSRDVLDTMTEEHVRLAVQLYHVIHELRDHESQPFKTTRNRLQHPRPSALTALSLYQLGIDSSDIPFNLDMGAVEELIKEESKKDSGDSQSSLFGQVDDPRTVELFI